MQNILETLFFLSGFIFSFAGEGVVGSICLFWSIKTLVFVRFLHPGALISRVCLFVYLNNNDNIDIINYGLKSKYELGFVGQELRK